MTDEEKRKVDEHIKILYARCQALKEGYHQLMSAIYWTLGFVCAALVLLTAHIVGKL